MKIISMDIAKIKPYENNPRYNDVAIEEVAKSIKQYGFKVPMVLDKNNVIVTGHTRYEASKLLGLKSVPVIIADDLTDEQIRAYRIADNKTSDFSIWDNKKLLEELDALKGFDDIYTGFSIEDIDELNLLDEKDNSIITNNEYGNIYEVVFKSEDESKIDKIQKLWEELNDEK